MNITSKMFKALLGGGLSLLLLFTLVGQAVAQCVPPPPGLVSWWPLDETSGTTTADIVDSNPGTVTGGAVFVSGKVGNALNFDGSNDTVSIAHNANLKPSSQITIDAWIKPNIVNSLREIYRKEDGNDRILLSFQPGAFCFNPGPPPSPPLYTRRPGGGPVCSAASRAGELVAPG